MLDYLIAQPIKLIGIWVGIVKTNKNLFFNAGDNVNGDKVIVKIVYWGVAEFTL